MTALRDEETQKNGVVWVMYNFQGIREDLDLLFEVYRIEKTLPPKIASGHYCYTDHMLRPYVSGIQLFSTENDRFRMRQHCGSPQQIEFELQTYGIPTHLGPMSLDGVLSTESHVKWLLAQQRAEERMLLEHKKQAPSIMAGNEMSPAMVSDTSTVNTEEPSIIDSQPVVVPHRFDVLLVSTGNISRVCNF